MVPVFTLISALLLVPRGRSAFFHLIHTNNSSVTRPNRHICKRNLGGSTPNSGYFRRLVDVLVIGTLTKRA